MMKGSIVMGKIGTLNRMGLRFFLIFSALQFCPNAFGAGAAPDTGICTEPSLFYAYESGVSSRLSLQDITAYTFPNGMMLAAAFRINLNQQAGLGLFSLSAQRIPSPVWWMKFHVEVAHLEYPDFYTGENQIGALINFLPLKRLILSLGMGYRTPDLAGKRFHSPFDWNHEMNEAYPLFNLAWTFVDRNGFRADLFTGNYYYMNFRSLDHIMFGVDGGYRIKRNIGLRLQVLTAVKGVSGFVFSVNEMQINGGVQIHF